MKRCILILGIMIISLPAFAGGIVTLEVKGPGQSTEKITAEIVSFANGRLRIHQIAEQADTEIAMDDVLAIDFGVEPVKGTMAAADEIIQMADHGEFVELRSHFDQMRRGQREQLKEMETALHREADNATPGTVRRQNMLAARMQALRALGEETAARQVDELLRAEYPNFRLPLDRRGAPKEGAPRETPRRPDGATGDTAPVPKPKRDRGEKSDARGS